MTAPANLAAAVVEQSRRRPELRLGTVDDQIPLDRAVGVAASRARELLADGLSPGDRVALVAATSTDLVLTWLACLLAGLPVAMVNPTYPAELTERMLAPLAPRRVIGEDDLATDRAATTDAAALPGLSADRFDVVSYLHTSGTTGLPKFCAQTHEYFFRLGAAMGGILELRPTDRLLAPLPMFHINPMGYGLVTGLLAGADTLAVRKFSASSFWPTVVGEGVTVLVLHAPPVEILKRSTTAEDARGHRVRTMFYADRAFLGQFDIPVAVSGYGSTEAGGISHLHRWSSGEDLPPNASRYGGRARADVDWRLTEDGEVLVRGREPGTLFEGYVTAEGLDPARDQEGWFHTGDLGRADDGDRLVFLERAAESIRVKGEFVPIPYVEERLGAVAGLEDLALWKRPGALVDEEVVLYAVCDDLPLEALRTAVAELPSFMRPSAVALVDQLPRDAAAGKVQRRLLTDHPTRAWIEL